jgi:GNAT superfamily N-acetyltransferase
LTGWHELAAEARIRFLEHLGRAGSVEVDRGAGVTAVISGVGDNTLNGVARARLDPERADRVIAAVVDRFERRRAPAIWWLDPQSTPADLAGRLRAAGLQPEETGIVRGAPVDRVLDRAGGTLNAAGRARDAAGRRRTLPDEGTGILVRPVREPGDLDRWIEVAGAAWGDDPPGDLARRRRLYLDLGLGPGADLQHLVALEGERTLGMASAFHAGQTVLLDHLEVAEQARRRGVGTALLRAALTEAKARGCRRLVLEPTPDSARFYDTLGLDVEAVRPGVEFYLPLEPPPADDRG